MTDLNPEEDMTVDRLVNKTREGRKSQFIDDEKRCSECKRIVQKGNPKKVDWVLCGACGAMYGY